MDRIKETTNAILLDPRNAALLSIIKAARNGAVYGAKVRFPHALVMVFLFRHGPVRDKLLLILRATRQHARNLGLYAALYKATLYLLRTTRSPPQKELRYDTFVAGLLGGYVVFGRGRQSSVNQQITIYVFARVVLGLAKLVVRKHRQKHTGVLVGPGVAGKGRDGVERLAWPLFASLSWAAVMYLFRWEGETLQPSLRSSMVYIYSNADRWDGFRNFLIFNQ